MHDYVQGSGQMEASLATSGQLSHCHWASVATQIDRYNHAYQSQGQQKLAALQLQILSIFNSLLLHALKLLPNL